MCSKSFSAIVHRAVANKIDFATRGFVRNGWLASSFRDRMTAVRPQFRLIGTVPR